MARLTKEIVNERLKDRGVELIGEYMGVNTKTEFSCKCNYIWKSTPNNIFNGNGCPLCAGNLRLSKDMVNNRLSSEGRGIELSGEYTNSQTKTEFRCNCGHKWSTTPNSIMNGSGCPICSSRISAGKMRSSKEIVNEKIIDRDIQLIGEYINSNTKSEFQCKYGHKWSAKPSSIIFGQGCPSCFGNAQLSKDIVNERLSNRGGDIWMISEYINSRTKSQFGCKCGNIWHAKTGHIMTGGGCPKCADYGFNPGKPGYIYILIFADYIKYGITNDLDRRLLEHSKNGIYTIATTKLYEDGRIAQNWESNIKIIFGGRFVSKDICPDGYTETLPRDKLQALLDTVK